MFGSKFDPNQEIDSGDVGCALCTLALSMCARCSLVNYHPKRLIVVVIIVNVVIVDVVNVVGLKILGQTTRQTNR